MVKQEPPCRDEAFCRKAESWCSSTEGPWSRRNVIGEHVIVYRHKRDVILLVITYRYIKVLSERSHGHTTLWIWGWLCWTRGIVGFYVSLYACLQLGTILHQVSPLTTTYEVGDRDSTSHYVFQKSCQVATLKTKASWTKLFMQRYAPLKISDDEFHYKAHRRSSWSWFGHQNNKG